MSLLTDQHIRPVEVAAAPADPTTSFQAPASTPATARVCAIIVTWNRKSYVTSVLQALSRQTYPTSLLDVVVIDNAGTDGTLDHLAATFRPERILDNPTDAAHKPNFQPPRRPGADTGAPDKNTLGLASLTLVRNTTNMGGCGGFNTGFAFVEHWFNVARVCPPVPGRFDPPSDPPSPSASDPAAPTNRLRPDFVWLVDDDVDLPPDAMANLVRVMESDPKIGLVGSRTCDINERSRTIETTIYFNSDSGSMQDDAPLGHARHDAHRAWIAKVGGPRGHGHAHPGIGGLNGASGGYRGTMDVDVVSACSMLARWSAVLGDATPVAPTDPGAETGGVGFWDHRYFIYCDDADWCLRFAKRGWRVVLNLDAVVFHTPWNLKLTPARIYYANRNRLWMVQKTLPEPQLRAVTERVMRTFLFDSMYAALHRRLFHANIILQTGLDAASNVGGKTGSDGPPAMPLAEALKQIGALKPGAKVAVLCNNPAMLRWLQDVQARLLPLPTSDIPHPTFIPVVRNDLPDPPPNAIVYGAHRASRLKKQWHVFRARPKAVIVFDQINDFPVLFCSPWTLHVDTKKPEQVQVERDGWLPRLRFAFKWLRARATLLRYARTVTPYVSETRYG